MPLTLTRELRIACAGGGKSTWIVAEASRLVEAGLPCLILTYTEENQTELKRRLIDRFGKIPAGIEVKGWIEFLLGDMIRPYQGCVLKRRLKSIAPTNQNPHLENGRTKSGTGEEENFIRHFTAQEGELAYSCFISKLAFRVYEKSNKASVDRVSNIYGAVFIDEVQDLVGWDYKVISALSESSISAVHAVGDFRQTIYQTAPGTKRPKNDEQKQKQFSVMKFEVIPVSGSYRCCQPICDVANLVYPSGYYEETTSIVDVSVNPLPEHVGVFTVSRDAVSKYVDSYKPAILRLDKNTEEELCEGLEAFTFGKAKGKQFNNVLIVPTDVQKRFFLGDRKKIDEGKTNKSKAQLYVALTRARHSVAILMDEDSIFDGIIRYEG